jgi:hypothetical protein
MAMDRMNSCSEELIRGFMEVKATAQVQFLIVHIALQVPISQG